MKSPANDTKKRSADGKKGEKQTRPKRAGLLFPVARIGRYLKAGKFSPRVGAASSVYMAAVLETVVASVVELAGKVSQSEGKSRIKPRHIQLGARNDVAFIKLLGNVTIGYGGVMPNIQYE